MYNALWHEQRKREESEDKVAFQKRHHNISFRSTFQEQNSSFEAEVSAGYIGGCDGEHSLSTVRVDTQPSRKNLLRPVQYWYVCVMVPQLLR
jgi:hypothetical protein